MTPDRLAAIIGIAILSMSAVSAATPVSLREALEPYLKEYDLPSFAAAVFNQGVVIASGAVGTRRAGSDIPVQIDDRFHLGSDTKAFTSLLVGEFVQQGKLRWDSTLAEIFPELKETMDPEFAKITLQELLSHTSGLKDGPEFVDLIGFRVRHDDKRRD